jgi:collagenase-like PrtC family protease
MRMVRGVMPDALWMPTKSGLVNAKPLLLWAQGDNANTMQLSVPTNWDPALLDQLGGLPVYELFGALAQDPVGSGRARLILPQVEQAKARCHVEDAHARGFGFNYLLNAPCMGNMEYDKHTHANLLEHLAWIDAIGVDSVTVTMPYLLRIIKRQFPRLRVKVSVIAQINNVQIARAYAALGADEINIDYMCNRDFRTLEALRESVACEQTLLVNDLCLYHCPYRQYHYNLTGHSTQQGHPLRGAYFDFCMISCTIEKLTHTEQLIRARWIRPEDLEQYERMGFSRFKLSGRNMSTAWIARLAKAYAARRYHGNLGDLLSGSIPEPSGSVHFNIDNQKLEGFLEHFRVQDCAKDCNACGYCEAVAARVVTIPDHRTTQYVRAYEHLLDSLESSEPLRQS